MSYTYLLSLLSFSYSLSGNMMPYSITVKHPVVSKEGPGDSLFYFISFYVCCMRVGMLVALRHDLTSACMHAYVCMSLLLLFTIYIRLVRHPT